MDRFEKSPGYLGDFPETAWNLLAVIQQSKAESFSAAATDLQRAPDTLAVDNRGFDGFDLVSHFTPPRRSPGFSDLRGLFRFCVQVFLVFVMPNAYFMAAGNRRTKRVAPEAEVLGPLSLRKQFFVSQLNSAFPEVASSDFSHFVCKAGLVLPTQTGQVGGFQVAPARAPPAECAACPRLRGLASRAHPSPAFPSTIVCTIAKSFPAALSATPTCARVSRSAPETSTRKASTRLWAKSRLGFRPRQPTAKWRWSSSRPFSTQSRVPQARLRLEAYCLGLPGARTPALAKPGKEARLRVAAGART